MKFQVISISLWFGMLALGQGQRPPAAPPPPATVDDGATVTITGNLVVNPIATHPAPVLKVLGSTGASTCTYAIIAKNNGGGVAGGAPTAPPTARGKQTLCGGTPLLCPIFINVGRVRNERFESPRLAGVT